MGSLPGDTDLGGGNRAFPSTLWTVVLEAQDRDSPGYRERLEHLVRLYWPPVYWFIRSHWRKSNEDAKDLTQEFFATFMKKDRLRSVGPEKGRFRTYLRVILQNFLRNVEEAAGAIKRGGRCAWIPIEGAEGELPFDAGPLRPDEIFDKAWACHVLREATQELEARYRASGKESYFRVFARIDLHEDPATYAEVALQLGLSVHDVENYLKHARASMAQILRDRIKETLLDGADVEEELRWLAEALRSR